MGLHEEISICGFQHLFRGAELFIGVIWKQSLLKKQGFNM